MLRIENIWWIKNITSGLTEFWIHTIFSIFTRTDHITVLTKSCTACIITVFRIHTHHIRSRYLFFKMKKLFSKSYITTDILCIIHSISFIRKPYLIFVNFSRFIWCMERHRRLSTKLTGSTIIVPLITMHSPSSFSLFWTKSRCWYLKLLISKYRWDFVVKINFWLKYRKFSPRNTTNFSFDDRVVRLFTNEFISSFRSVLHKIRALRVKRLKLF